MSPLPLAAMALSLLTVSAPALAQTASVELELNKLETVDGACRTFFVVRNPGETAFEDLDVDLVTFRPDGVIGTRFQVALAPLPADKTVVKPYDVRGVACDQIDRLLLNDVVACAPLAPEACLGAVEPASLGVEFFK